jgi:hypothetical protein
VIYLDPPWRYLTYDRKRAVPGRAAVDPYATMTLDQLKALPAVFKKAEVYMKHAVFSGSRGKVFPQAL